MRSSTWICLLLISLPSVAAILHVPADHVLIQSALDASQSGDTVLVAPGHYHERLVLPSRDLTLVSEILLTGDTLAMDATILDGDLLGSTVTIAPQGSHRYHLEGFTIQGGMGALRIGGALAIGEGVSAVVRHVTFAHNQGPYGGSAVLALEADRVELDFIRLDGNSSSRTNKQIVLNTIDLSALRNLHVTEPNGTSLAYIISRDSTLVSDVLVVNQTAAPNLYVATSGQGNFGYTEVRDVFFRNNRFNKGVLLSAHSSTYLVARNCWATDNEQWGNSFEDGDDAHAMTFGSYSSVDADSIYFLRNRASIPAGAGGTFSGTSGAWIRNVLIQDCVVGDSSFVDDLQFMGSTLLYTYLGRVRNCEVSNNTIINRSSNGSPRVPSIIGYSIHYGHQTVLLDSCKFSNNTLIDLDFLEYATNYPRKNTGWGITVYSCNSPTFWINNCTFENNTMPNIPDETRWSWIEDSNEYRRIGSFMRIGLYPEYENPNYSMTNCRFSGNDDGGLEIVDERFTLRNLILRDNTRMGLRYSGPQLRLDNALVEGLRAHLPASVGSHQMALEIRSTDLSTVSQSTFIHNQMPTLLDPGPIPSDTPYWNQTRIINCLIADNDASNLTRYQDSGTFAYCLLPSPGPTDPSSAPGVFNLWGIHAGFDLEHGPPYLASSPCVDNGSPESEWNDREDPAQPGRALWPSLGGLRSDIGFTGGPHASVMAELDRHDTLAEISWIHPTGFSLGIPWPNPFNPVTHIPFTLARPMVVRLSVHNLLGQEVAVLADGLRQAGTHAVAFAGGELASGLYLITLDAGGQRETRSISLVR